MNVSANRLQLSSMIQLGYVVNDIDAALRHWTEVMKVGPFILLEDLGEIESHHRGERTRLELRNAFSYFGDVQVEIIQQMNDAPSPYLEFIRSGQEGLQHVGAWSADFTGRFAELEAGGFKPVFSSRLAGATHPSVYFEGPQMGLLTELSWATPEKERLYDAMARVAREWDGTRPVRVYPTMADFAEEQGVPSWNTAPSRVA